MKYLIITLLLAISIYSCDGTKSATIGDINTNSGTANDTVRIANDSLEYEIIIIEPGFNQWLITQPPQGYYGLGYLENRNKFWVTEYNQRVRNFTQYSRRLYEQEINYDNTIDYGYEVNYMLYNYFVYFQKEYNQKFIGGRG